MSTFNMEQLQLVKEMGEIIRLHNQAMEMLQQFRTANPNAIPPNLARMAEENLKENVSVLYRELNNVNKPATARARHVCRDCHNVFVVPLPGGICDECRAKLGSPGNAYSRPQMPEVESETVGDMTPVEDEADKAGREAEARNAAQEAMAEDGAELDVADARGEDSAGAQKSGAVNVSEDHQNNEVAAAGAELDGASETSGSNDTTAESEIDAAVTANTGNDTDGVDEVSESEAGAADAGGEKKKRKRKKH